MEYKDGVIWGPGEWLILFFGTPVYPKGKPGFKSIYGQFSFIFFNWGSSNSVPSNWVTNWARVRWRIGQGFGGNGGNSWG